MPITLPPISRRQFLAGTVAAGAGYWWARGSARADPATGPAVNPNRFALLSDAHIDADPKAEDGKIEKINMTDHLKQVVREVIARAEGGGNRPAAAIINGDLAHKVAQPGDYSAFIDLVRPLREAGFPLHMALGNHDNRERFWEAFPEDAKGPRPVEDRQILTFASPRADFFVLDTLDHTNSTPGVLGEAQLKWLADALDAAEKKTPGKPALVFTHHHPAFRVPSVKGLVDWEALMAVLLPRKQVKAHFFGHTHRWEAAQKEGLHLVNLPTTAYIFDQGQPNGWVDLQLATDGASLELLTIDPKHPKAGDKLALSWR